MGKIVISSSEYNKINNFFDFMEPSKKISVGKLNITAYKKLRIDTKNFAQKENNWIIGVGTYIYKAKIDSAALFSILEDIENKKNSIFEAIEHIRVCTYGNYCFVLFFEGKLYVFVDLCGAYRVYYYMGQDEFVLTNTWYHINQCLRAPVLDHRFAEYICMVETLDSCSPCKDILRLRETEVLEFHTNWVLHTVTLPKGDEKADFWQSMNKAYCEMASAIKEQGILFTGGQDSRLNLAMLLGVGVKPKLYYGVGNSRDTNTKKEDRECFERAAKRFDLPFRIMNWENSELRYLKLRIKELGEMAAIYNGNSNIYNEFLREIDSKCVLLGYGSGEWIRNNEYNVPEEFDLEYYLEHFYPRMMIFKAYKDYSQEIKEIKKSLGGGTAPIRNRCRSYQAGRPDNGQLFVAA